MLTKLFENKKIPERDKETLKWILRHLLSMVVGNRWNGLVRDKEDKKKSFTYNVSASDIGFAFYLLEYYGKAAIKFKLTNEKAKKSHWSKITLTGSLDYYTSGSKEAREMYQKLAEKDKPTVDETVIEMLKEDSDGDEENIKRAAQQQNDDSDKEVYADFSFFDEG